MYTLWNTSALSFGGAMKSVIGYKLLLAIVQTNAVSTLDHAAYLSESTTDARQVSS